MIANVIGDYAWSALVTFFVAMVPVLELRGAIPMGVTMGLPIPMAYFFGVLGNLVPVPFIMLFIRKIFRLMRKHSQKLSNLVESIENRAKKKAELLYKYELFGLILLVAIPLPGTGAWTGALVATLLKIRLKVAIPCIIVGVLIAGILVCLTVAGVVHVTG